MCLDVHSLSTCAHGCMHTHLHIYMCTYIDRQTHIRIIHVHTCTHKYKHTHTCMYTIVSMYIPTQAHTHKQMCMCTYKHMHRYMGVQTLTCTHGYCEQLHMHIHEHVCALTPPSVWSCTRGDGQRVKVCG